MNEPSTEQLMAFADGELPPAEHEQIAAQVAASPELQQIVAQFVRSRTLLHEAFDAQLAEPVPQRLIDAVRTYRPHGQDSAAPTAEPTSAAAPQIKPLPGAGQPQAAHPATARRPAANRSNYARMALAATITLTIGLLAGLLLQGGQDEEGPPALVRTDAAMLQVALETRPSGTALSGRTSSITPQASFTVRDGSVCREYTRGASSGPAQAQGLACRGSDGQWRIESEIALAAAGPGNDGYAPAAGDGDPIAAALDRLGAGASLNAEDEARLMQQHWQTP